MDNEVSLQRKKENYLNQLNGMKSSEMTHNEAKLKLAKFVKGKESQDDLAVSGDGSAWAETVSFQFISSRKHSQERSVVKTRGCVVS
jgi:hypothetical protein